MTRQEFVNRLRTVKQQLRLGTPELARAFGCHPRTVEKWLTSGPSQQLPSESSIAKREASLVMLEADESRRPSFKDLTEAHVGTRGGGMANSAEQDRSEQQDDGTRVQTTTFVTSGSPTNGAGGREHRMTDEQANNLLRKHEVIRDPLHGDITITGLERRLIDTQGFQRLRGLMQLGPTHLVYPGAVHTRFLHAVGTVYCAEQLVQIVNANFEAYKQSSLLKVVPYAHLLVRLTALLHDLAHLPFGHTLEDEGFLVDPEWKDEQRRNRWFSWDSSVSMLPPIFEYLTQCGIEREVATVFANDVKTYVLWQGDNPCPLEFPYVIDLVGNTLCADLLDYLDRDAYFCGLRERSGDRVIKYLAITKTIPGAQQEELAPTGDEEGCGRVTLLSYRMEQEHLALGNLRAVTKLDVFSEAIDLLRRRFSLAEKVFFHRTKIAASAMLISAAASSTVKLGEFIDSTDEQFLDVLAHDTNERTKRLIKAYNARGLYKPLYRLNVMPESDDNETSKRLWRDRYDKLRDPANRTAIEREIEDLGGLPPGSVCVYCPDRRMNLKEFEMLVQARPGDEIKKLSERLDPVRRKEMEAINERFQQLWALIVFVDPRVVDPTETKTEQVQDLNMVCEALIGFPNDNLDLRGKGSPLEEQMAKRVIDEWQAEHTQSVPFDVFRELTVSSNRSRPDMRAHLKAVMATFKSLERSSDADDDSKETND